MKQASVKIVNDSSIQIQDEMCISEEENSLAFELLYLTKKQEEQTDTSQPAEGSGQEERELPEIQDSNTNEMPESISEETF